VAGALTYYFNAQQQLQRIAFEGNTGDPRKLLVLLRSRYQLTWRQTNDPALVVYEAVRSDNRPASALRIVAAPVVKVTDPGQRFALQLVLERPRSENGDWLRRPNNAWRDKTACGDGACPLFRRVTTAERLAVRLGLGRLGLGIGGVVVEVAPDHRPPQRGLDPQHGLAVAEDSHRAVALADGDRHGIGGPADGRRRPVRAPSPLERVTSAAEQSR